jgi:hypothetical protein
MDRGDVRAFVDRDWAAIEEQKARFWSDRKHGMTAVEALAVGDALRRHAQSVKPDWPDDAERRADLAVHARVAEALRAVSLHRPR